MKTQEAQKALVVYIQKIILDMYSIEDIFPELTVPSDKTKADLVMNIAFQISKHAGKAPIAIAQELVEKYNSDTVNLLDNDASGSDIKNLFILEAVMPGFINIRVTDAFLTDLSHDVLQNPEAYGNNESLKNKVVAIEHTSPNPNKAMHVGHLRNNLIGMSLVQLYKAAGAKVISEMVDNNRGIAIAKAMWGYLISQKKEGARIEDISYWIEHKDEWNTPESLEIKSDFFVDKCYAIGSDDAKNNPEAEEKVRQLVVDWENNDDHVRALWKYIIDIAHSGMEATLDRIGNHWDMQWHEHEHYLEGKELVEQGVQKRIFTTLEDGAVLTQLKETYNIPETILLKSDGTSLYITQDIALTKLKKEKHNADHLITVTGSEQTMAMKQVYACCEQLGIGSLDEFTHISYGLVTLQDAEGVVKKMSSRDGGVIHIDTLIDMVKQSLLVLDREYDDQLAEKIAVGAIKYSLLRAARTTNILLNIEESIALSGDSGVYVMYTHSRIQSLLAKAKGDASLSRKLKDSDSNNDNSKMNSINTFVYDSLERKAVLNNLYLPYIIFAAIKDNSPNLLVDFLLTIAHDYNAMYAEEKIISEDITQTMRKLLASEVVADVMQKAFVLLNIELPERV